MERVCRPAPRLPRSPNSGPLSAVSLRPSEGKIASKQPELQRRSSQRSPDELVMLGGQPLEGSPPHPLWFGPFKVENPRLPSQTRAEPVSAPCCAVTHIFAGAGIGEPITMPASEDATALEDRDTPPAADCRADEPGARRAEVAWRAHDTYRILLILPFPITSAVLVDQEHAVLPCAHLDRCHGLPVAHPFPAALIAGLQHACPRPAPHVQCAVIVCRGLRAVAPMVAATRPTH